jgi:uncharacterized membrane protein
MAKQSKTANFFQRRWRTLLSGIAGVIAAVLAGRHGFLPGAASLIGWNVAAFAFVLPTGWIFFTSNPEVVRTHARAEDENRAVLMGVVLAAVAASLIAIVVALKESKTQGHGGAPAWVVGLSALTLVLSWLVVQCLYTLHYTHRYFGDRDDDGAPDGGIDFPGDAPTTYRDFIYVAVCVGSTCQVSDFDITTSKFRNLVTTHALISFVFNTSVLALGINIIGNLLGQ